MKKLISVLTVLTLLISCCVISAGTVYALDGDYIYKELSDGTAEITGYTGEGGDVTLPSALGGLEVTSLGDKAFYKNKNLKNVTLPDSITHIGDQTFAGSYITGITMTDAVIDMGTNTFTYCVYLEDITLSAGLNTISNNAFSNCTRLESVVIPEGVGIISTSAFQFCNHLTSVSIPSTVYTIDDYAFAQTAIEEIALPENTTEINYCAFFQCENLKAIEIPAGVKEIGDYAFSQCSSLSSVTLNEGTQSIGTGAFDACPFKEITIPASVTSIADYSIGFTDYVVEYERNKDLVITCYYDSAAYKYASTFLFESVILNAPTEPETTAPTEPVAIGILGDSNSDGKVNVKDATQIQKSVADLITLDETQTILSDVDSNTKVNVKDATAIQKFVAGMETGFKIGELFYGI